MSELECVVDTNRFWVKVFFGVSKNSVFIGWISMVLSFTVSILLMERMLDAMSEKKVGTVAPAKMGKLVRGMSDGVYGFDFETGELAKHCDPMEGTTETFM